MTQENQENSSNWLIKLLGSAVLAGTVAIAALIFQIISSRNNDNASETQQANQAIQIAQQQTQIALADKQNQVQYQQLTLAAQKAIIEGQILTPSSIDNGNFSLTATAFSFQATQIESTSQAIAEMQTSVSLPQPPKFATSIPPLPTYTLYPTQIPYPTPVPTITAQPTLTLIPQTTTFMTIFANQAWQDTGVAVNTWDTLTIKYVSGLWRWTGDRPDYDGNGDPTATGVYMAICTTVYDCPITDAPLEALVGKIGLNGVPFLVGNGITVPNNAGNNQKLFLMGNDSLSGLGDNVGSIEVSITR